MKHATRTEKRADGRAGYLADPQVTFISVEINRHLLAGGFVNDGTSGWPRSSTFYEPSIILFEEIQYHGHSCVREGEG